MCRNKSIKYCTCPLFVIHWLLCLIWNWSIPVCLLIGLLVDLVDQERKEIKDCVCKMDVLLCGNVKLYNNTIAFFAILKWDGDN